MFECNIALYQKKQTHVGFLNSAESSSRLSALRLTIDMIEGKWKPNLNQPVERRIKAIKALTDQGAAVHAHKGLAESKSYKDIARGGMERDPTKTVTIITSHVQYETAARHYGRMKDETTK